VLIPLRYAGSDRLNYIIERQAEAMTASSGTLVAVTMALICLQISLSEAQAASREERESLRGLQGVQVVIEDIEEDLRAQGLSKDKIRTAVERVMRSSGIPLLRNEDQDTTTSRAWFHVQVGTLKDLSGRYAYMIRVFLRQKAFLEYGPSHSINATTWESPIVIGTIRGSNLQQLVVTAEEKTKEFATDFLAQNPR
jgi:hypothetical protein